jgi:hypothetical protein
MIAVTPEQAAALGAALGKLEPIIAQTNVSQIRVVMDYLRVRSALELGLPTTMSPLSKVLAILDDDSCDAAALERDVLELDPADARVLLQTAPRYLTPSRAVVLDDILAARSIVPEPRFAALLALAEPARCEAFLARIHAVAPWVHVDAVAEAYLALVDHERAVPPTLAAQWTAIVEAPNEYPSDQRHSARLRGICRRDAAAGLACLVDTVSVDASVEEIPLALMAVLSRAVARDHASAWSFLRGLTAVNYRALSIEALAVGSPESPELAPTIEDVLTEWRGGGSRVDASELGVLQISTPLLGACAVAGRLDIARTVIDAFVLSMQDIAASMVAGTRLRFARTGGWRPGDNSDQISDPTIAAVWTIETLPLLDLPWVDYADHV